MAYQLSGKDNIKNLPIYKRRFIHELTEILNNNINNSIEFFDDKIEFKTYYKKIYILIILTKDYPWKPPEIKLNNILYIDYIKSSLLFNKLGVCYHCTGITNKKNWSPAIRLYELIIEIKKLIDYKQELISLLLIKKIKKKYLVDDIPLEEILNLNLNLNYCT